MTMVATAVVLLFCPLYHPFAILDDVELALVTVTPSLMVVVPRFLITYQAFSAVVLMDPPLIVTVPSTSTMIAALPRSLLLVAASF